MKQSTVALLAVAGIGAYLWWKNNQAQAQQIALNAGAPPAPVPAMPVSPLQPVSPPPVTVAAPAAPVATPGTVNTQVQGAIQSGGAVVQDLCYSRVTSWFNTLDAGNKNQAFSQLPNMTEDELTALCLIFDQWAAGHSTVALGMPQSYITFWNSWRVKYHILDGTYA